MSKFDFEAFDALCADALGESTTPIVCEDTAPSMTEKPLEERRNMATRPWAQAAHDAVYQAHAADRAGRQVRIDATAEFLARLDIADGKVA